MSRSKPQNRVKFKVLFVYVSARTVSISPAPRGLRISVPSTAASIRANPQSERKIRAVTARRAQKPAKDLAAHATNLPRPPRLDLVFLLSIVDTLFAHGWRQRSAFCPLFLTPRLLQSFPRERRGLFSLCDRENVFPVQREARVRVLVLDAGPRVEPDPPGESRQSLVSAGLHDTQASLYIARENTPMGRDGGRGARGSWGESGSFARRETLET